MSGAPDDDSDKPFDPSEKKLSDARDKGEIPRSADLVTTGAYAGLLLAALSMGGPSLLAVGGDLAGFLDRVDAVEPLMQGGGASIIVGSVLWDVAVAMAPWAILPMALALGSAIVQRALLFTGTKLAPKLSRIDPIGNAKSKFGRNGLFEFAKSTVKLTIYCGILFAYLAQAMPRIMAATVSTPGQMTQLMLELSVGFLTIVLGISLVLGGVDFLWQRAEHLRKHRMSRKDLTDEAKESEGDPHFKQARRQRGYDIAMNGMMADVPEASVIIVNPTHYAVALKWDRSAPGAPVCVAKGVDLIAARIREAATEAGVPIHADPPTARALHAVVEIGQEVRAEHYAAVAIAIRFAEDMRRKARS